MTTIKKTLHTFAAAAALALASSSCSGFLEEYSQDLAKVESWTDLDEVLLGDGYLHSCRVTLDYSVTNDQGDNLDILHFMGDELRQSEVNDNDYVGYIERMFPFYTWQQDTGLDEDLRYVGGDEGYWNMLYSRINVCNMVISLIDEQPETDADDRTEKERVKGEAHFLRAAYYFILVNLYGFPYAPATADSDAGVPVKLTSYVEDVEFPRETVAQTYRQILGDLEAAEQYLEGKSRASVYHANLTATHLLQSRVYLYMQDWPRAIEYARMVLDEQDGLLDLHTVTEGNNSIYAASPETIFSMGDYLIAVAFADNSRYQSAYYLSEDMLELFGNRDDLRSRLYVGHTEQHNYAGVFMKVNGQRSQWGGYFDVSSSFLLRTPEAYLTLAEASAYNGDEGTARSTLETFLATRMDGDVTVTQSGDELVGLIRDERAREFLLEGHRWFDLRRYTVCEPYPWSKTIEHGQTYYDSYNADHVDYYRLEEYDQAYTLPIPREIRSFQPSLGNNPRPERRSFETISY